MSVPVNINVSPALDPETVKAVEGYDDTSAPFISGVVAAFQDAYLTVGKIHDATAAGKANPAWTEEQRLLIVGKEASKQQDRLLRRMDSALRDIEATITHTKAEIERPIEARALGVLNQEIRAHARSLSREERSKLIREAMEADADDTLASILGSPHFLSGLSEVDWTYFRQQYHAKRNPALVARLQVMEAARDKIDRDGRKIIKELQKAVGAPSSQVRGIDLRNEAALAALKIEPGA